MKTRLSEFLLRLSLLAVVIAGALAPTMRARAAEQVGEFKPLAVVSVFSYNDLISDLRYIGKLADSPALADLFDGGLAAATRGRGLVGIDKTRPWGVAVLPSEGGPEDVTPLCFLPVDDLQEVLKTLALLVGKPAEKVEEGVYKMVAGTETVYVKQVDKWAFITRNPKDLASVPNDPLSLLGELPTKYDIAVQVNVQNIPEMYRQMAIEQIKDGATAGMNAGPAAGEDEETYKLRQAVVKAQMENIASMINDTDTVTVAFNIDAKEEAVYFDLGLTAVPGTKFAKKTALYKDGKSGFTGFNSPDAAITFHGTSTSGDEEDVRNVTSMIELFRVQTLKSIDEESGLPDDATRKVVKDAVAQLLDMVSATVKEGSFDMGGMVMLAEKSLTAAAGVHVADGSKIEDALKSLAELAEANEPGFKGVKWDVAKHEGVRFHSTQVPVEEEDSQKVFGENLEIVMGVGEKELYLAFGKDPLETLKKAIDASKLGADTLVSPFSVNFSIAKIMAFAAAQDGDFMTLSIAQMLAESKGKDHVTMDMRNVPDGFFYRVQVEEGVIKALAKAGSAAAGM